MKLPPHFLQLNVFYTLTFNLDKTTLIIGPKSRKM